MDEGNRYHIPDKWISIWSFRIGVTVFTKKRKSFVEIYRVGNKEFLQYTDILDNWNVVDWNSASAGRVYYNKNQRKERCKTK